MTPPSLRVLFAILVSALTAVPVAAGVPEPDPRNEIPFSVEFRGASAGKSKVGFAPYLAETNTAKRRYLKETAEEVPSGYNYSSQQVTDSVNTDLSPKTCISGSVSLQLAASWSGPYPFEATGAFKRTVNGQQYDTLASFSLGDTGSGNASHTANDFPAGNKPSALATTGGSRGLTGSVSATFTPGAGGTVTKTYDYEGQLTTTGQFELTGVDTGTALDVTETTKRYATDSNHTPASRNYSLTDEYTTAELIARAESALGALGAWGAAAAQAKQDVATDELSVSVSKFQFRITFQTERDRWYLIQYRLRVTPENGEPSYLEAGAALAGTGEPAAWESAVIGPPGFEGTIELAGVRITASCPGEACPSGCGLGTVGSVRLSLPVGQTEFGLLAGSLWLHADAPNNLLSSPAALQFTGLTNHVEVLSSGPAIAQVKTPSGLIDIQTESAYGYTVRYYSPTNVGAFVGGLYETNGEPYVIYTVENQDGATASNRLWMIESRPGSAPVTNQWTYVAASNAWEFVSGNGLRKEVKSTAWLSNYTFRVETEEVWDLPRGVLVHKETATFAKLSFGEALVKRVTDPDGLALVNTYQWGTNSTAGSYGKLWRKVRWDGYWEEYGYDSSGRLTAFYSPHFHSAAFAAPYRTVSFSYNTNEVSGSGDNGTVYPNSPRRIYEDWPTMGTSYEYFVFKPGEHRSIRKTTFSSGWTNDANALVTVTRFYTNGPHSNRVFTVTSPDGVLELREYFPSSDGWLRTNVVWHGQPGDGAQTNVVDGTRTVTVVDLRGAFLSREVFDVAGGHLVEREIHTPDDLGRAVRVDYLDGTFVGTGYGCCGNVAVVTNRDGTVSTFEHDALRRQIGRYDLVSATDLIGLLHSYDALGNNLSVTRLGTNGSQMVLSRSGYDGLQRLVAETNAVGDVTTHSYALDGSGRLVKTTTYAAGTSEAGTRIETSARNGEVFKITGTAVRPERITNLWNSSAGGRAVRRVPLDTNFNDTAEYTQTTVDGARQPTLIDRTTGANERFTYNAKGQVVSHSALRGNPDWAVSRFTYDGRGNRVDTALDLNLNAAIDYAGTDRITRVTNDVVSNAVHGVVTHRTRTYVWPTNNVNALRLEATVERSVDGLQEWRIAYGLTNHVRTEYLPGAQRRVTGTAPDGSQTITLFEFGRLASVTRKDALGNVVAQTSCGYDAHGRKTTVTDLRTGATTYTFDNADRPVTVVSPAPGPGQPPQTDTTIYDARGRAAGLVLPDNTTVTNLFYPTDDLKKSWGSRTYPQEYTYDPRGRALTLTTWQDFAAATNAAVTTWKYHPTTGLLTNKQDHTGKGESYTYTSRGQVFEKKMARAGLNNERYTYGNDGLLTEVRDSANGPILAFTRDRLGRVSQVVEGATWNGADPQFTRTYLYNDAGQVVSEAFASGPLGGLTVSNAYDGLLRRGTVALHSGAAALASSGYAYDALSRLDTVSSGARAAAYAYLSNSPLVRSLVFTDNGATRLTVSKSYDNLNRLQAVHSTNSQLSTPITFNYHYNAANQRVAVTNADNSRWTYGYDALGQVTNAVRSWAEGGPVPGQQFAYAYDDIGNRRWTRAGGDDAGSSLRLALYTNNLLNQITSREVPGYVEVQGSAHADATVTVNLQPTYRHGEFYRAELAVSNAGSLVWQGVTNLAVLQLPGGDMLTTNKGNALVPKTPQVLQYDLDGNLTNDGVWSYVWDALDRPRANRLKYMSGLSALPTAARQALTFRYDYAGRRITKVVSNWTGSAWAGASTNKFLYDGWNLIAELNHSNVVLRSYTWGTDASGTMDGAGGVGGLLAMTVHLGTNAGTYFYAYDGNHNVAGLVNAGTGEWAARYEYGPFGELLRASGPVAFENPFLFSTKYLDWESGLYYYGHRYYDPVAGRWLNRDPIEEAGGANLYGFVGNDPVDHTDTLGLFLSFVHRRLTRESLDASGVPLTKKCKEKVYDLLADANTGQDSGDGFDALERHFNRPYRGVENAYQVASERRIWDDKFRSYVGSELAAFDKLLSGSPPDCAGALQALGRTTHSWQDFYAHAISSAFIRRWGMFVEFNAWTYGLGGNPDSHPQLWPSSYNKPFALESGEHPNTQEPVSGREADARKSAARSYVAGKYGALLKQWLEKCPCFCTEK